MPCLKTALADDFKTPDDINMFPWIPVCCEVQRDVETKHKWSAQWDKIKLDIYCSKLGIFEIFLYW